MLLDHPGKIFRGKIQLACIPAYAAMFPEIGSQKPEKGIRKTFILYLAVGTYFIMLLEFCCEFQKKRVDKRAYYVFPIFSVFLRSFSMKRK